MIPISYDELRIREFNENDIENKLVWINDSNNNQFLHYNLPLQYGKTLEWYRSRNRETRLDCVIEYKNIPVGLVGILNIDKNNRKAEFYISMGNTEFKNKGIATKACLALIKYTFIELNLHKLYLTTDEENHIAHKLFEKVGFEKEGLFKKDLLHGGKYIDRVRYGLINRSEGESI